MNKQSVQPPFPWLQGKVLAAREIWARFGNVTSYVDPFARSIAMLLARPHAPRVEVINEHDGYIANFWRALKAEPHSVAFYANLPLHEVDLRNRYRWLVTTGATRVVHLAESTEHYDARAAGWWLSGRCRSVSVSTLWRISARLRRVRILCEHWSRVVNEALTIPGGLIGIFLDPPYGYDEVRNWAIANGERPTIRIALAGCDGRRPMPRGWTCIEREIPGGAGTKCRVWFSPSCLPVPRQQAELFTEWRDAA